MVVGQPSSVDQGGGQSGLGVLLLGVVERAGAGEGGEGRQCLLGLTQRSRGVVGQADRTFTVEPVDRPDGAATGPDGGSARPDGDLASGVGGAQLLIENRLESAEAFVGQRRDRQR
ncbi:MAG: hypothetical protein ACRD0Q_11180 [Acidimicrobiales bacterium]